MRGEGKEREGDRDKRWMIENERKVGGGGRGWKEEWCEMKEEEEEEEDKGRRQVDGEEQV